MPPIRRLFLCLLLASALRALELHPARPAPTDLAISGLLHGVPADETRFPRWADLAKLPSTKLKLTGEFVPGEQEVTVVFLTELWKALPLAAGADTLLATCTDGYASVDRDTFIASHRPFLILAINGQGPEKGPPPGLKFNPGPYVISVAAAVAPTPPISRTTSAIPKAALRPRPCPQRSPQPARAPAHLVFHFPRADSLVGTRHACPR